MNKRVPASLLVAWAVLSCFIFLVARGFAGGVANLFFIPWEFGLLAVVIWATAWLIIVLPFVLLVARIIGALRAKR